MLRRIKGLLVLGKMRVTMYFFLFWKPQWCKQEILTIVTEVFEENDERPKHCWNLINTLTGRKSSKQGIINVKDEDWISKWYVHFKNLLGIEPVVEGSPEENIKPIINNLIIPDVLLTKECQVFSCEFCEISKNTFFTEHFLMTASGGITFTATTAANMNKLILNRIWSMLKQ